MNEFPAPFKTVLRHIESILFLTAGTFFWLLWVIVRWNKRTLRDVVKQMELGGVKSFSIVSLVSFFLGLTLAMLTSYQLRKVGSEIMVGGLVGVSFTRELGPLITALVVAGRVGAGISAEIGTMTVSEEVEALETMGINPIRYLIVPRFLALLLMLPCLTVCSNIIGMLGGFMIGYFSLDMSPHFYYDLTMQALVLKDIVTGLIKSLSFAAIISIIGCYQGLIVRGGAEGVGLATTRAVVVSMILIIAFDCFWNGVFYFL